MPKMQPRRVVDPARCNGKGLGVDAAPIRQTTSAVYQTALQALAVAA